jgi:hypothetical protein
MSPDRLSKAVLRRLKELGLPDSLIDMGEFREKFFLHRWTMFVRDGDKIVNVHLIQPQQGVKPLDRESARIRQVRRNN